MNDKASRLSKNRGQIKRIAGRRRLNVKLAVLSVLIVAIIGGGIYLVRREQIKRFANRIAGRTERPRDPSQVKKDIEQLYRYITFTPTGPQGKLALDELLTEKLAKPTSSRVTEWEENATPIQWLDVYLKNENALSRNPDRTDLRRNQIIIGIAFGRFSDARKHIETLSKSNPTDGELAFLKGICDENELKSTKAVEAYRLAIERGFTKLEVFARLASLLKLRLKNSLEADEVVDAMVSAHPNTFESHLIRAQYRKDFGSADRALLDVRRAEELAPNNRRVILLASELSLAQPDLSTEKLQAIRERLQRGLQRYPKTAQFYQLLSQLEAKSGNPDEAVTALRRGKVALPENVGIVSLLADLLIARGKLGEAKVEIGLLHKLKAADDVLNLHDARLLIEEGQLLAAKKMLEPIRDGRNQQLSKRAGMHLALCYQRMGDLDKQLAEFRRASVADPHSSQVWMGMAEALTAMGQDDLALRIYRKLTQLPQAIVQTTRILFEQTLRMPMERRDWKPVEFALNRAAQSTPDAVDIGLLRAKVLKAQGHHDQAHDLLESLVAKHRGQVEVWTALANLAMQKRDWDRATKILDDAQQHTGDHVSLRLTRAALLAGRPGERPVAPLAELEQGIDAFSKSDRLRLLEGLAAVHFYSRDANTAIRIWTQIAEQNPHHLRAQFRLFHLKLQLGDGPGVERALATMRQIEGNAGPFVTCAEAVRLIRKAKRGDEQLLKEARVLLLQVADRRPRWPLVPLNLARIDELEHQKERAALNYRRAVELGNRDPIVIRRAFELLFSSGQYEQADRLVEQIQSESPMLFQSRIRHVAAEVSLKRLNFADAVALAESAARDSNDFRDHVWLGQMLSATGKKEDAEQSFREATKLSPSSQAGWVALVQFLVRTGQRAEAEAAVSSAEKQLPKQSSALALALCHVLIKRIDVAEQYYRAALSAEPNSPSTVRATAAFFVQTGQPAKAEPLLRKMIDPLSKFPLRYLPWARRSLAVAIAPRSYARFRESLNLLDTNIERAGNRSTDRLVKARLLVSQPRKHHLREAARLLESVDADIPIPAEDLLVLARLYDALGEERKADARWKSLMAVESDNPKFLIVYLRRLLDRKQFEEAADRIELLSEIEPDALTTVELRSRLLVQRGQFTAAVDLLKDYADVKNGGRRLRMNRNAQAAELLGKLSFSVNDPKGRDILDREAERRFRLLVAERPQSGLALATFFGRRNRLEEAFELCEKSLTSNSNPALEVTEVAFAALRSGTPNQSQFDRLERWLLAAGRENSDALAATIQLADFRMFRNQRPQAAVLYRRVLDRSPTNVVALNNLAGLLSIDEGQHLEAERLINAAIQVAGPLPSLLDTRGTVLLNKGETGKAIGDFEAAIAEQDTPVKRFHLALARWKSSNRQAALTNLRRAKRLGLQAEHLPEPERDSFRKLCDDLNVR